MGTEKLSFKRREQAQGDLILHGDRIDISCLRLKDFQMNQGMAHLFGGSFFPPKIGVSRHRKFAGNDHIVTYGSLR